MERGTKPRYNEGKNKKMENVKYITLAVLKQVTPLALQEAPYTMQAMKVVDGKAGEALDLAKNIMLYTAATTGYKINWQNAWTLCDELAAWLPAGIAEIAKTNAATMAWH